MQTLPLLTFEPLFQRYLWGGRRLGGVLGKAIGPGDNYAESWEIVDHSDGQSVVADGPLVGRTLGEVVEEHNALLFGRHAPQQKFPLLLKFLDANRTLSVQVHPNDAQGAKLDPPDLGKTEAWVVLAAEPGAKIYAGLRAGVDREGLAAAMEAGTCDACLHVIEPAVGDCVFIPAGTVHALGEGIVIAEIQQASNTTFRLFDWNRVDKDGQPRPLHIRQSLEVTDFDRGPVEPQTPEPTGDGAQRLVTCDKFVLERRELAEGWTLPQDDRFHILAVVAGEAVANAGEQSIALTLGSAVLAPARRPSTVVSGEAVLLDMYLP
ncbi:putative mannose-6-phosphate isomerase GmuF [Pirellulimonas nuda]|uniref:Phosphohexomutase n=1 Tax=Pirellulimonas nuda TaxID=2528009 RepID=A0A518D819_9BACT|nr:type I phosphomannose isomerase catalytic subunit [Pirellulimonas nuda]QDU87603.1 putative mannose-6-phosphate isomerase GmuF [Pirellulimonas nuda]